jgi:hypothetical protein
MKRITALARTGLWLVGAAALVILLIVWLQVLPQGPGATVQPATSGRAYPAPATATRPVQGYPGPPIVSSATPGSLATALVPNEALATASAPPPRPTPGPVIGPQTITDPAGNYRLELSSGWWASLGGETILTNYDEDKVPNVHTFPPDGLKIQIGVGQLQAGQTFQQWTIITPDDPVVEIDLPSNDGRVIVLGLSPADSPAMPDVLAMLASLEILPRPSQ